MLRRLLALHPDLHRHQRDAADPAEAQRRLLRHLLEQARDTTFGRAHRFADLLRAPDLVQAYQQAVPLHSRETMAETLARVRHGEENLTWPGRIRHFAISSGTASAGTILPRTAAHLKQDARFSVGVGLHYLAHTGRTALLGGPHLSIPGRVEPDPVQPGAVVGEVSGLVAHAAPAFFRHLYQAVPDAVADLPHWEAKLDAIAQRAAHTDLRMIAMVPSWSAALFARVRDAYRARHGFAPDTMREIWPNLQVFISGGVALSSYQHALREQIGGGVDFVETYGASEGFFSFMERPGDDAMRLHLSNGVFYEFVPEVRLGEPDPPRLTLGEVETGVRYALHVSTMSGLWAYAVADFVRFTHLAPPRLVVAGRTRQVLDRFGEAVHAAEAGAAFAEACAHTGAQGADFHVTSVVRDGVPHHRWVVSFERLPDEAERLAGYLDAYLQRVNRHYTIRREGAALGPPEVVIVEPEAFLRWLHNTRSHVGAQSKVPRLSEEPDVAARIIAHSVNARIYPISF